ncbi:protein translocase subunit SecF [Paenibacillus cymbidii]|uniref:protein translocase subunit SecF n=1 Tax=Paenibacillus cymbidii TaxID=1639034 RepID=UPI001F26F7B1|nr:protein translocase subunit SecF [Paenibacillus cymbidii]
MTYNNRFDFMKHRNIFFSISLVLVLVGIILLPIVGLHFGVDFKAGTSIDVSVGKAVEKEAAEKALSDAGFSKFKLTVGGNNSNMVSLRFDEILSDVEATKVKDAFSAAFGTQVSQEVNAVSPDMAQELGRKAIYAVLIASLAICIYVSFRFEWRFAVAAIIAILHDAFMVVTFFAIFRFEVNLPFIAAVLTTIGYSINDKIVIFDRIRENVRFAKLKTTEDLSLVIHQSIWQTMARNVYTVVTVLIAAVCLFLFGSEAIKLFALAKIIGLTSGAYSSICIASPLWFLFKNKAVTAKKLTPAKE